MDMQLKDLIGKMVPISGMGQCRIDDIEKNDDGTYRLELSCPSQNDNGDVVGFTSIQAPRCTIDEQAIVAYLSA